MSEVKDRLIKFLDYEKVNKSEFGRRIGVSSAFITSMRKSIQPDKIIAIQREFPNLDTNWLLTGEGEMLKGDTAKLSRQDSEIVNEGYLVPLIPVSVMAGDFTEDPEGVILSRCERIVSPVKGVDMAFPVYGDSMEPEYPGGSNVFVKKIYFQDFIPYGNVFVLDTTNGPLLKKVQRSDKSGYIRCVSLNVAAGYEPFDVPLRTVRNMYRVVMCMSMKG